MKKAIYFFAIITASLLFNSCSDDDDDVLNITIGDETTSLRTGISFYYGESDEGVYNTDLVISSINNSDVRTLLALELALEEGSISGEDYEEQANAILENQDISGFYIEAFSDVIEKLSVGGYSGPLFTLNANTYTEAGLFNEDNFYELAGILTVVASSRDYYELEFLGETSDGEEVRFSFEGDFIYNDYSDDFSRSSAKGLESKSKSKFLLNKH